MAEKDIQMCRKKIIAYHVKNVNFCFVIVGKTVFEPVAVVLRKRQSGDAPIRSLEFFKFK